MKIITRTLLGLSLPALLLATGSTYAEARLQSVDSAVTSGKTTLRLHFDSKVGMPKSFAMNGRKSIVLDFPGADTSILKRSKKFNSTTLKNVKFAKGANKLRVMVSLNKLTKYSTRIQDNDVVLTFDDKQSAHQQPRVAQQGPTAAQRQAQAVAAKKRVALQQRRAQAQRNEQAQRAANEARRRSVSRQAVASNYVSRPPAQTSRFTPRQQNVAHNRPAQQRANHAGGRVLGAIDFQRTQAGGGRAVIKLPHPSTVVESHKAGNVVVITIKDVRARSGNKRIDVTDFATPASFLDVTQSGRDVKIRVLANAAFKFNAVKDGNSYIVNFNKVKPKLANNPFKIKKKKYSGKKLSLNFQDIEVRSVLQLLADFTDKNIVVSDTVKGNITLRLKDVPWDQALDIVLETKGLAMRSNGNVIWVAPASELDAKEQREMQAFKRKQSLEPLVTEYISVNYAKAEDLAGLIKSSTGKDEGSLLSKRGSVSLDKRTNTLLVQDTADRVSEIRSLVRTLDVSVRQVSVESRIVIASDEFSKDLGTRFGVTQFGKNLSTSGSLASTSSMSNDLLGNSGNVAIPSLNDRLNVNMPIPGAAKMAFSILSKDYLIDLELSALQAENKGEIVSTPRVVTADKKKALIEQGVEIPYKTVSSSGTKVQFKKAVLALEVTPQITPDEHVIMDLKVSQDTVGAIYDGVPSINTREVNTQVLVENGQTVVLGGVHEEVNSKKIDKVPLLGDLPVVGKLFQRTFNRDNKRELLIFVTPKILK